MWFGWYRWPGWYLSGVLHVVGIVVLVDVVLGPTLTLIIANPAKPRSELTRDLAIIVSVQLVALIYGATTLWEGRPLYYTFSVRSPRVRTGIGHRPRRNCIGTAEESRSRAILVQPAPLGLGAAPG